MHETQKQNSSYTSSFPTSPCAPVRSYLVYGPLAHTIAHFI